MVLKKRILGILLIAVMIITYMPAMVFAETDLSIAEEDTSAVETSDLRGSSEDLDNGVYGEVPWRYTSDHELIIGENGQSFSFIGSDENNYPWDSYRQDITSVRVEGELVGYGNLGGMFWFYTDVNSIDLTGLDTQNVTNMSGMFEDCRALSDLNISGFNTANVTNMSGMFLNCCSLPSLDVGSFDTTNVTLMGNMFCCCRSLLSLDVSNFNTGKVEEMQSMFGSCSSLYTLDLSNFDASRVVYMQNMFDFDESLNELKIGKGFNSNTSITPNGRAWFPKTMYDSESGTVYSGESFIPSLNYRTYLAVVDNGVYDGVPWMINQNYELVIGEDGKEYTFDYQESREEYYGAGHIESSDYPWYRHKPLIMAVRFEGLVHGNGSMGYFFANCPRLTSIDLTGLDTTLVTDMTYMFSCGNLYQLDLSGLVTSNVVNMTGMFNGCNLKEIDVSKFDTSKVAYMGDMFGNCTNLTDLDLTSFDTGNVTDMAFMFNYCPSLKSVDLSSFDTSNVEHMNSMFFSCYQLEGLDLSGFNTCNVTEMDYMFWICRSLTRLDLSSFDTSKVIRMEGMFQDCYSLEELKVTSFETNKVEFMFNMFANCVSLKELDLSNFDASSVGDMQGMFGGCNALTKLKIGVGFNSNINPAPSGYSDEDYFKAKFPIKMYDSKTGIEYAEGSSIPSIDYREYVVDEAQIEPYDPEPEQPVAISPTSAKIAVGGTLKLNASGPTSIAYKSSNKAVVTVSASGIITAIKPGSATITAYSNADNTNKATCKVTVKYKLTYKMNGGKNSPDNLTWYTGKFTLKKPKARTGYDFGGWYSDSKFKNRVKTVTNANKTLYAKWNPHSYSIKFEKNGGKGSQSNQKCKYGKEYSLTACKFTKKGYDFRGWNTKANGSGKVYLNKEKFKNLTSEDGKTIKLYAQWKATKYKIKYDVPEGTKNKNKTTYTIETATFKLKDASCKGYDFKGWYSDKKKTKKITSIKKGDTGNKTIYSKWTPHKYTIKFEANGGDGEMSSLKCTYGKEKTLTKNTFTMKKYDFAGWNTKPDGSGKSYQDAAKVKNLVTKDGGSITLYAQWKTPFTPRIKLAGLSNSDYMKRSIELLGVNMPNCTTYALARALEITKYDYKKNPNYVPPFIVAGHSNAEYWWENNKKSKNPYPTGQTPKVGAIAVWKGNMGHVAIVEVIDSKGHVYYSHSSYGGLSYEPKHPYPGSVNNSNFHCESFFTANEEATYLLHRELLGYIYLID